MKLTPILTTAALLGLATLSGCAAFKQDTLAKPIELDATADYKYGLHAVQVDSEGNETIVKDADAFELKDVGKKDSFSHVVERTYFNPYTAKIEGYNAAANIAAAKASTGEFTEADLSLAVLLFQAAANEQMGQYVHTENVDASRTNDADALAAARIAQFEAQAEYKTERNKRIFDSVDKGIEVANPAGALASNLTNILGGMIANTPPVGGTEPDPAPVAEPEVVE
ncbi:MAG: hypothetical protein MJH10_09720 [Epibacterium sp.]|nr:hypothetical protein [Epibacterium sp.]NQX73813.1 hypothetical protein [Epibacterium sp.]